jgi:hypothetical protein
MPAFLPPLDGLPAESAIIGRLLVAYGELEFDFAQCLEVFLNSTDTALRVLFE